MLLQSNNHSSSKGIKVVGEFFKSIVLALIPRGSDNAEAQLAWRWTVALLLIGAIFTTAFSFAWAQGKVPGLMGVATQGDVARLKDDFSAQLAGVQKSIGDLNQRADTLELLGVQQALRQTLVDACTAQEQNNQRALDAANNDLDAEMNQFERLAHRAYVPKSCDTILIKKNK